MDDLFEVYLDKLGEVLMAEGYPDSFTFTDGDGNVFTYVLEIDYNYDYTDE